MNFAMLEEKEKETFGKDAKMRTRFISRTALLLLAAFLVVVTQSFTLGAMEWLFVGGGVLAALIAAGDAIRPGTPQRAIDGAVIALSAWLIVEALVFSGTAMLWISFGGAVGLAALALVGLVLHERSTERVVHELTVTAERPEHALA